MNDFSATELIGEITEDVEVEEQAMEELGEAELEE